jgi:hypothetical protein
MFVATPTMSDGLEFPWRSDSPGIFEEVMRLDDEKREHSI